MTEGRASAGRVSVATGALSYEIGHSLGLPKMLKWIQAELKTGFYLRVLKEADISVNSNITLVKRGDEKFTIAYVNNIFYHQIKNADLVNEICAQPDLSSRWRDQMLKRHQKALNVS